LFLLIEVFVGVAFVVAFVVPVVVVVDVGCSWLLLVVVSCFGWLLIGCLVRRLVGYWLLVIAGWWLVVGGRCLVVVVAVVVVLVVVVVGWLVGWQVGWWWWCCCSFRILAGPFGYPFWFLRDPLGIIFTDLGTTLGTLGSLWASFKPFGTSWMSF
jgi:hypothetical protein